MKDTKSMFDDLFQLMIMGTNLNWGAPGVKDTMEAYVGSYILRHETFFSMQLARAVANDVEANAPYIVGNPAAMNGYIKERSEILVWWNKLLCSYIAMPQGTPVERIAAGKYLYDSLGNVIQSYVPNSPPPIQAGMAEAFLCL